MCTRSKLYVFVLMEREIKATVLSITGIKEFYFDGFY